MGAIVTKPALNVVTLNQPDLMNVPESLRRLAGQMESGEVNAAVHVAVVAEDANGEINTYGYGAISGTVKEVVGLLHMAAFKMSIS